MKIDILEALQHLEQQTGFGEPPNRVIEVELLQHVPHVLAESRDVVSEVCREVRRVREQLLEVVSRRVVEREARCLSQLRVEIFKLAAQLRIRLQHAFLCRREHAIEPPQHREWQNHTLVFAAPKRIADQICNSPNEINNLPVAHL